MINTASWQSEFLKPFVYRASAYTKRGANFYEGKALIAKSPSFVNVPRNWQMMKGVFAPAHYAKILNPIIQFVAINVVNNFMFRQFSTKEFFHVKSVFSHLNPIDCKSPVSVVVNVANSAVIGVAILAAVFGGIRARGWSFKAFPTTFAGNSHPVSCIFTLAGTRAKESVCLFNLVWMSFERRITLLTIHVYHFCRLPERSSDSKKDCLISREF